MQIADLLHTEPAELRSTDSANHMVAGTVIHLDDQHLAAGAWLDVVLCVKRKIRLERMDWSMDQLCQ